MAGLLELDQAEQRLRPFARRYLGVRAVPVASIVGTDSRSSDFDREFRPLRPELRSRRQRVAQRFPDGDFPPIVVNKLGEAFFVLDGHYRVAVARSLGMETIDAEVTEHARVVRIDLALVEQLPAAVRIVNDASHRCRLFDDPLRDGSTRTSEPVPHPERAPILGHHLIRDEPDVVQILVGECLLTSEVRPALWNPLERSVDERHPPGVFTHPNLAVERAAPRIACAETDRHVRPLVLVAGGSADRIGGQLSAVRDRLPERAPFDVAAVRTRALDQIPFLDLHRAARYYPVELVS
jgi:hypothetical protein